MLWHNEWILFLLADAPDTPTFIRIEFTNGAPTKVVNKTAGVEYSDPLEAFNYLNQGN